MVVLEQSIQVLISRSNLLLYFQLHQATLTSLKGEIIELRSRLQRESLEKDSLEKQLGKLHVSSYWSIVPLTLPTIELINTPKCYVFYLILIKLAQNVSFDDPSYWFKTYGLSH